MSARAADEGASVGCDVVPEWMEAWDLYSEEHAVADGGALLDAQQNGFEAGWNAAVERHARYRKEPDLSTLGGRVIHHRQRQGLTVSVLAERAGMNKGRVSWIENGRTPNPGIHTVDKIARALGLSILDLLPDDAPARRDRGEAGEGER